MQCKISVVIRITSAKFYFAEVIFLSFIIFAFSVRLG